MSIALRVPTDLGISASLLRVLAFHEEATLFLAALTFLTLFKPSVHERRLTWHRVGGGRVGNERSKTADSLGAVIQLSHG